MARFLAVLLEQATQIQLGPHLPVRVNRESAIGRALQVPADNFAPVFTTRTPLAFSAARADLTNRWNPGIVTAGDESSTVEADNIEPLVIRRRAEGATHSDALAVTPGTRDADPIRTARRLRSVCFCLIQRTLVRHEFSLVTHALRSPSLRHRQPARHRSEALLKLRELTSERVDSFLDGALDLGT